MSDQAAGLRSLFARRRPSLLIVAGSDVDKAAVAAHFGREAAASGRATVLIDGTAGQLAAACHVACRYELAHVVAGDIPIADVLRPLTAHLLLLPAARALARFDSFTAEDEARLAEAFSSGIAEALRGDGAGDPQVDLIVVLAEDGGANRALEAFGRDARIVIVASDHASSLRGAYAEMKDLAQHGIENFEIVVATDDATTQAGVAFANLAGAARRFLEIDVTDGGVVVVDRPRESIRPARAAVRTATSEPSTKTAEPADASRASPSVASSPTHPSNAEVSYAAVA